MAATLGPVRTLAARSALDPSMPGTALLLGSGPLVGRVATALESKKWITTRATDAARSDDALVATVPRAILLQPVDLREAASILADIAHTQSARGIPVLAVLDAAPAQPEDLPAGADAYLVDPSNDDLLEALGQHVVTAWSRALGGQQALDIIESLDDSVLVVDRLHRVVYHNPKGLALVQRTSRRSGTLLGSLVERALPAFEEGPAKIALEAGLARGETAHLETRVADMWVSLDIFPNPDGATIIARDITVRHELEATLLETRMRLAHSEKLGFLGELVSGIAHEVRTPLVYLGNHLELIRTELQRTPASTTGASVEQMTQHIEHAWEAWDRAVRIMKELQHITRLDPAVRARVDLSIAMEDAIVLFAALDPRGARVERTLARGLYVHADVRKLQQVVLNLLQNAADASAGDAGPIEVTTRALDDGRAELVVKDAGIGMSQHTVDRMYDPLFTTKKNATGLGLGVVSRVVQGHGGSIRCATTPGLGTTFTIELPLIKEAND